MWTDTNHKLMRYNIVIFGAIAGYSRKCNTCNKRISCNGGCTTNMAKHLRQQHGIQIKECTVFEMLRQPPSSSQASSSSVSPAQPTASTSSSEPSQSDESSQSQSLRPNVTAQANKLVPQHKTPFTLAAGKLTDTEQLTVHDCGGDGERSQGDKEGVESEEEEHPPPRKTVRMTPLEELFADEDAVKMTSLQTSTSIQDRVEKEL
uniref:uncharacterized protein LOC117258813 n=1 Tax=Epinephelus lanceolatus TaxID=310571 RepID=UPI0014477A25|nr:uncharacterized protein LOC117258813 [Epinephelus lanceolatus]